MTEVVTFLGLGLLGSLIVVLVIPRFIYRGADHPGEVPRRLAVKWTLGAIWLTCGIGLLTEFILD